MAMEQFIRLREQNGEVLTLPVTREPRPHSAERVLAAAGHQGVRETSTTTWNCRETGTAQGPGYPLTGSPSTVSGTAAGT